MPEPKQSTLDTLAEMLAEYKLKITRLEVALSHRENRFDAMEAKNKELEDRLADCAKQKNAEPDTTNLFLLGAQKKLCEAKDQRIQLLENTLAERTYERDQLAKQHKDITMPETPTKLEAYWKGFSECAKKDSDLLEKLTQERDALKIEYESRALYIAKMAKIFGCENHDGFNCKDHHAVAQSFVTEAVLANKSLKELRKEKEHYEKLAQGNEDRGVRLAHVIQGLRKEKEHYEKVAQESTNTITVYRDTIRKLNQEVEDYKSNNRYHRGHSAGYAEALAKVQDFVLKSRE